MFLVRRFSKVWKSLPKVRRERRSSGGVNVFEFTAARSGLLMLMIAPFPFDKKDMISQITSGDFVPAVNTNISVALRSSSSGPDGSFVLMEDWEVSFDEV